MREMSRFGTIFAIIVVLAACADANTSDNRGYTKAPLEDPGVVIKPEGTSTMDELGSPIVPRDTLITEEQVAAPAAATPQPTATRN